MTAWKAIERAVAALVGGKRTWNSDEDIDVQVDGWAIECKNVKGPTVAQCELWLQHNQAKADSLGLHNGLVVKRRAGRGRPSPYLFIAALTAEGETE